MPGLMRVGDTVLVATGSHGKFVSRLDIEVKDKKVAGVRFKLMPVFTDAIKPDASMSALVEKVRAPFAKDLARVIGKTDSLLYRRGNFNGTFDDLICDAMLSERDAEIALSPGFRWGGTLIPDSPITWEDVTNAIGFDTSIEYPMPPMRTMSPPPWKYGSGWKMLSARSEEHTSELQSQR